MRFGRRFCEVEKRLAGGDVREKLPYNPQPGTASPNLSQALSELLDKMDSKKNVNPSNDAERMPDEISCYENDAERMPDEISCDDDAAKLPKEIGGAFDAEKLPKEI